jgi:hypothetical protein
MKSKQLLLPFLFFLISFPVQSYHMSIFPRYENSEGEKRAVASLLEVLRSYGTDPKLLMQEEGPVVSQSVSISVHIQGNEPRLGTVIFLVPLNHPYRATQEQDYSAGIEAGLAIVKEAASKPGAKSVEVLFLGGEFPPPDLLSDQLFLRSAEGIEPGPDGKGFLPAGSLTFLETFYPEVPVMFVYLSFPTPPATLAVIPAGSGKPSPSWLYAKIKKALDDSASSWYFAEAQTRLNRLDLQDGPSPIDPYLQAGYPAIEIRGKGTGRWEEGKIALFLRSLIGKEPIPSYQDNHYLILGNRHKSLIISERNYLLFLLVVFAGILTYPFIAVGRFKKYLKTLLRHVWSIPLLVAALFVFLLFSTLLLGVAGIVRDNDQLWRVHPSAFLWFKISIASLLFFLNQRLFGRLPFSRRGSFYSASALFFLLADIIIISFFDIGLTSFIISTFVCVFFFTIVRHRMLKLCFLLLSLFPMIWGLYGIFTLPAYRAVRFLLLSPLLGNLIMAVHLLPYLLMTIRIRYLFHHPSPKITKAITIGLELVAMSSAVASGIYILKASPLPNNSKLPLNIEQNILPNEERADFIFTSPIPIPAFQIDGHTIEGTEGVITQSVETFPLAVEIESEPFLSRKSYSIDMKGEGPAATLTAVIRSEEPFTVLDASRQWSMAADRKSVRFLIENFPSLPFTLDVTLPRNFAGTLELELYYPEPRLPLPDFDRNGFDVHASSILRQSVPLK